MKIDMKCFECDKRNKVELNEEFILNYTCEFCGKVQNVELGLEKYQVLFDLGIICLKNGYYKESVSDFAAALERMFEFAIKCILNKNQIDEKITDDMWKEIKNQSERQYGAFVVLYAREFEKNFRLDSNQSGFRNNVIHKGVIPNFEKTYKYAEYIYTNIYSILVTLLENGYLDNYAVKRSGNKDMNVDAYISFIHHFKLMDNQNGGVKNIPAFDKIYDEFYINGELIVPMG